MNGGYVDTMGFLALAGLFTAHVTGNFVTLGAAIAFGSGGAIAKLLALPIFCLIVLVTRIGGTAMEMRRWPVVKVLLSIKFVLLAAACAFAFWHGPFRDADAFATVAIGMVLVAAMAVQNTVHRAHMTKMPPTTLMTGTTTQIMVDLGDLLTGNVSQGKQAIKARLSKMILSLLSFAAGCVSAAGAFLASNTWCFIVPPVLIGLALLNSDRVEESS
ncbi:uncharacterized membrane protein YoaK (UPF0700 family) [Rhizobium aquaticum]|uniref:Uncharacterized membrane protein YoaK (UPF0700 family) n=1 Tax=Rhizobium aquaticum TaxID=1549636 RepID=A0ABV2J0I4_9HYPH